MPPHSTNLNFLIKMYGKFVPWSLKPGTPKISSIPDQQSTCGLLFTGGRHRKRDRDILTSGCPGGWLDKEKQGNEMEGQGGPAAVLHDVSWGEKQGSQTKSYKLQADLAQSSGTSAGRAELRVWVSPCRNKAFPTDYSF
jgi:hypothetical protein